MQNKRNLSPTKKFVNKLAMIEQQAQLQADSIIFQSQMKFKLRAVNMMARSDPNFIPKLPSKLSTRTANSLNDNDQQQDIPIQSKISINNYEQIALNHSNLLEYKQINKTFTSSKDFQKSMYFNKRSQQINDEIHEYCFQCDQLINVDPHQCCRYFIELSQIDSRFNHLLDLNKINKIQKFDLFIYNASLLQDSISLRTTLLGLKYAKNAKLSNLQQLIRKRLINLLSKKIGMILQKQDSENNT